MAEVQLVAETQFKKHGHMYVCTDCPYTGKRSQMENHLIQKHGKECPAPYVCPKCNRKSNSKTDTLRHLKKAHDDTSGIFKGTLQPVDLKKFKCVEKLSREDSLIKYVERAKREKSTIRSPSKSDEVVPSLFIIHAEDEEFEVIRPGDAKKTPSVSRSDTVDKSADAPKAIEDNKTPSDGSKAPDGDGESSDVSKAIEDDKTADDARNDDGANAMNEDESFEVSDDVDMDGDDKSLDVDATDVDEPIDDKTQGPSDEGCTDDTHGERLKPPTPDATEKLPKAQSPSEMLLPIAEVGKVLTGALDGLVSTLIAKTRLQPLPPHLDMAQVAQELVETNVILRKIGNQFMTAKQPAPPADAKPLETVVNKLQIKVGDLAAELRSTQRAAAESAKAAAQQAEATSQLCQAVRSHQATMEALEARHLKVQQQLVSSMRAQQAAFYSIHKRFSGLIEDERRGGQVNNLVRHILDLPEEMQAIADDLEPPKEDLFGPMVPAREPSVREPSATPSSTDEQVVPAKKGKPRKRSVSPERDGWDAQLQAIRKKQKN